MKNRKVAIIGCGNLGLSIVQGLLNSKEIAAGDIIATRRNTASLEHLAQAGVEVLSDNVEAVAKADIVIVAVKPYNVEPILVALKPELQKNSPILISVATGVSLREIKQWIEADIPVFRAMPNTATDVQESITCICENGAKQEDLNTVNQIFNQLGETILIPENLMEAATVMGACGIAYVMRFIRAMIQGGIEIGFDAKTASAIVNQTVKGASELLISRGEHPEFEIDKVTTPKGCTITGLNEMEHNGFSSSLIKGIVASYEKIEN